MNPTTTGTAQEQPPTLRREPSPFEVSVAAIETLARAARIATSEAALEIAIYKAKVLDQDRAIAKLTKERDDANAALLAMTGSPAIVTMPPKEPQ